jgi:1-acyl-sn-glycerol-3-phosphate acyltransferase
VGRFFYWVFKALFTVIFRGIFSTVVRGRERVPAQGGLVVLGNHLSFADPPLLGVVMPRPVDFMAMAELFRFPVVGWLARAVGAFPVDRRRVDHRAAREAVRRLQAGRCVAIFPEGGIRLGEQSILGGAPVIKDGAAAIAELGRAAVLPVIIRGTRQPYEWRNWFRRARLEVTFGFPFCLWTPAPLTNEQRRRRSQEIIRAQLLNTVELR